MPPSLRGSAAALSPAARALRLQRIYARMQDGAACAEIAAEEGVSRERLWQMIPAATTRGRPDDRPDYCRMQIARLTPALRLVAAGVAEGDPKAIPLMLQIMDGLDRYSHRPRKSTRNGTSGRGRGPRAQSAGRAAYARTGIRSRRRGEAQRRLRARASGPRRPAKPLKTFKTAMGISWKKLAWIWGWRHVRLGLAPRRLGVGAVSAWD